MLNNKTYDILKYVALIALPAIQVFWLTIAKIWSLNYGMEIGATIGACALLLGTLLGVSTSQYNKINAVQTDYNNESDNMLEEVEDYEDAEITTEE